MKNLPRAAAVAAVGLMVLTLALTTDGARVAAQGMKPLLVQIIEHGGGAGPGGVSRRSRAAAIAGGPPSDVCPDFAREVQRVLPDGTFVQSFTVPPGKMLVLTDLEAHRRAATTWHGRSGHVASVGAFCRQCEFDCHSCARTRERRRGSRPESLPVSVHLQTGGVIGPNIPVCLSASHAIVPTAVTQRTFGRRGCRDI